jgi:hypothetical protein
MASNPFHEYGKPPDIDTKKEQERKKTPFTTYTRDPGWAEIFIPLQAIELSSIQLNEPTKLTGPGVPSYAIHRPISILSYTNSMFRIPVFSILTPFLQIHSWDSSTGKLELLVDSDPTVLTKCTLLQEHIIGLLASKPQWTNSYTRSKDELRANFQTLVQENCLTVYLHGPNPEKKQTGRVWIWQEGGWQKGASATSFKRGQSIRVALRLQGICFLQTLAKKMRYRIQHQVVTILHKPNPY